jgi:hypothetical protein
MGLKWNVKKIRTFEIGRRLHKFSNYVLILCNISREKRGEKEFGFPFQFKNINNVHRMVKNLSLDNS